MSLRKGLRFRILKRDRFRCRYCGAEPGIEGLHVDHIQPRSKGGSNNPSNLVTACIACNSGKSAIELSQDEWENLVHQGGQDDFHRAYTDMSDGFESLFEMNRGDDREFMRLRGVKDRAKAIMIFAHGAQSRAELMALIRTVRAICMNSQELGSWLPSLYLWAEFLETESAIREANEARERWCA